MQKNIFSIETSCDETAVSVVSLSSDKNKVCVYSQMIHSQESHLPFGGVVPEIAARDHLSKISFLAESAIEQSGLSFKDINAVAVTLGPGLIGALMVGVLFARGLVRGLNVPLIGVNHVDAHLAPCLLLPSFDPKIDLGVWKTIPHYEYPILSLTVSGGHCHLSLLHSATEKEIIGKSLDDACGEAFDKVAKLLGLSYPGGPLIEILAERAVVNQNLQEFILPKDLNDKDNKTNFSYSGLKTSVMEIVRKLTKQTHGKINGSNLPEETKEAIAYAFQNAALHQLKSRVLNALSLYKNIKGILIAGGVAQNKMFRKIFSDIPSPIVFAPANLCSDNATMIGLNAIIYSDCDANKSDPFSKYIS